MRLKHARGHMWQFVQAAVSGLAVAVVTFTNYKLHFNAATVVLLYMLVIVCQSLAGGSVPSTLVSLGAAICLDGASGYLVASGARSSPPQWK
jgi:K+-sensing histidine kinase KdpD